MKKETKRKLITRTLSFVMPPLIVGPLTALVDYNNKLETVAKVNTTVRNQLYQYEILNYEDFFNSYKVAGDEDRFVTVESLEELEYLTIDIRAGFNLNDLKKCPNIKELKIKYAELLTDEDINTINDTNIEKVLLEFDIKNLCLKREDKFDVSRIKKDVVISNNVLFSIDDLESLIFLNYLDNYDISMFESPEKYENYIEMDNKLNDIYNSLKINNSMTDKEKILLISNYICNNLDYDSIVSNKTSELFSEQVAAREKSEYYNYYSISSVLEQNEDIKNAICINYASLFDILCYKAGVKSRVVIGYDYENLTGHAWNLVYIDNKEYYIDLTWFDKNLNEIYLYNYASGGNGTYNQEYYYEELNKNIFKETANESYSKYTLYPKLESLDKPLEPSKNRPYINNDLEGEKVLNKKLDKKMIFNNALCSGLLGIIIEELYRKKKNKKLELTSNE